MDATAEHLWIVGAHSADRIRQVSAMVSPDISVSSHRGLRGPFSGICAVLNDLVPEVYKDRPELVDEYQASILYAAPELSATIGPARSTLTSSTPHEERTRFFGLGLIRAVSHGLVTFLGSCAELRPLTLFFDDAHNADPAEQEFLELLLRRGRPELIRVVVGTASEPLPAALAQALDRYARRVDAPSSVTSAARADSVLARDYVAADGTSDDPRELESCGEK